MGLVELIIDIIHSMVISLTSELEVLTCYVHGNAKRKNDEVDIIHTVVISITAELEVCVWHAIGFGVDLRAPWLVDNAIRFKFKIRARTSSGITKIDQVSLERPNWGIDLYVGAHMLPLL